MISADIIYRAGSFYQEWGFKPTAVPATIDPDISAVTRPPGRVDLPHLGRVYPASAEQSFLQMLRDKTLAPGRYQALTPCYRDEPVLDHLHHRIFLKVELIIVGGSDYLPLLLLAQRFFSNLGIKTEAVPEGDHFDLMAGEVELGSYGIRRFEGQVYSYGTGVAEPRTSDVLTARATTR